MFGALCVGKMKLLKARMFLPRQGAAQHHNSLRIVCGP